MNVLLLILIANLFLEVGVIAWKWRELIQWFRPDLFSYILFLDGVRATWKLQYNHKPGWTSYKKKEYPCVKSAAFLNGSELYIKAGNSLRDLMPPSEGENLTRFNPEQYDKTLSLRLNSLFVGALDAALPYVIIAVGVIAFIVYILYSKSKGG